MWVGKLRILSLGVLLAFGFGLSSASAAATSNHRLFEPSTRCIACHNGLVSPSGEDVSMGKAWRPTMMANAARDPYWQAGVRREMTEHPTHASAIQDECSKCHMPMATTAAHAAGQAGDVFGHFAPGGMAPNLDETTLARDGVSCTLCHQIQSTGLGQRRSLVGGFVIDTQIKTGERKEYGPYVVDRGRAQLMRSASRMVPQQAAHLSSSELCATCHTLYTNALDEQGRVIGEFPEQVPYQEWLHSDYRTTRSCQACHMPVVAGPVAVSSVAGLPRERLSRHDFVGGNFFMQGLFARFGSELFADAPSTDFQSAAQRTRAHLQHETADLAVDSSRIAEGKLRAIVTVTNRAGHKLPTAYPSRRVWFHVTVRSARGAVLFESGALRDDGSIVGNDNDVDATRFEPHYTQIQRTDEVAIYEAILGNSARRVTTGLLTATHYLKDNRLLPRGFDKATAHADVAVHGDALQDADFQGGRDAVAYEVLVGDAEGPFKVSVELLYQPIGFRWAENLKEFSAFEPQRFVAYYKALAPRSAVILEEAQVMVR